MADRDRIAALFPPGATFAARAIEGAAPPLHPGEAAAVARVDLLDLVALPSERAHDAALLFSAKESVYKCLYPTAGHFLEFHDVELAFGDGTFTLLRAAGYAQPVHGRFAISADHVATVAIISDR